jgi:hypothetical protein
VVDARIYSENLAPAEAPPPKSSARSASGTKNGGPNESHGCNGNIVAEFNQSSGIFGASGDPKSSAGPGYLLKTGTAEAVREVREEFCP